MPNNKIGKIDELVFHANAYKNNVIDEDDLIQAFEEILYGKINGPGIDPVQTIRDIWK